MKKSKKSFLMQLIVTLLLAALYGTGLPFGFTEITLWGEPITFQINMLFIIVVILIIYPIVFQRENLKLKREGITKGIYSYGTGMVVATIIMVVDAYYEAMPFDRDPSIWEVLSQCIILFFLVGMIEELLLRGCLFNLLREKLGDSKRGIVISIVISAVLFSLMHLVGAPADRKQLIMKLIWTLCGGIAFAIIYYLSNNLWCGIILHWIMDITVLPMHFSSASTENTGAVGTLIASIVMMIIGCFMLEKRFRKME